MQRTLRYASQQRDQEKEGLAIGILGKEKVYNNFVKKSGDFRFH